MDTTPEPAPDEEAHGGGGTAGPDGTRSDPSDGPDLTGQAAVVDNEHEIGDEKDPLRFNRWMKRSATGAMMTGISLGLREALENKKNEPALMIEASGRPEDPDHPIRLEFDPDNPADTVAFIRPPAPPEPGPPAP